MTNKINRMLASAFVLVLLVPAAASAQSSKEGYAKNQFNVAGLQEGGDGGDGGGDGNSPSDTVKNTTASGGGSGSLPFTGADLGVLAGAGVLLLGMGFGLRRLTHRPSSI